MWEKLPGVRGKKPRCYSWPRYELAVCGRETSGVLQNLSVVQLPHVLFASLTSQTTFGCYILDKNLDTNRLTHRNARHPSRTIFASISWGTSGSWWPWRSRGSSLSLVPLAQQRNHHLKFALEASTTQKYSFPERMQDKFKEATAS